MAIRVNLDPTYDLGRHIATGEKGCLSGDYNVLHRDEELDRNDPMDDWTRPASIDRLDYPLSAEEITHMNLTQALSMSMGDGHLDQSPVDLHRGNREMRANDENGRDLQYGNNNTGNTGFRGPD